MCVWGEPCLQNLHSRYAPGQTKALADLATAGCALLRLCLPEDVVDVPTFSHVLSFSLPKAARASGSSEQEDDVEHSQEEDALEGEGTSDADEGLEDEEELDERLTGEEELAPDTADTSLQHQGKAQSVESACHVAVRPKPTEGSPGESCAQQEPGWDDCSTSSSAMCQEDNGLLFVKSRSPPPLTGEQLLTTEDSDRPESDAPGLQSRAIPGEEGEGHSASTLSLPPSSDHSDTCLSLKTSSDLSASSSSSALPGRDLSQFDHFFPELGNRCSPSSAVALGSKSGHCGSCGVQGEEGEEEEILTVESVSTSELLTTDEGSQLSVSNVEDTGSKEEVAFLQEGVCMHAHARVRNFKFLQCAHAYVRVCVCLYACLCIHCPSSPTPCSQRGCVGGHPSICGIQGQSSPRAGTAIQEANSS